MSIPFQLDLQPETPHELIEPSPDEKSWIKDFFTQLVDVTTGGGKLSCVDLNRVFFPCKLNVIQDAWSAIASDTNLQYFIAMSQYLNGDAKGIFFSNFQQTFVGDPNFVINAAGTNWQWPSAGGSTTMFSADDELRKMILYFEKVLLGVLEMKEDPMLDLMDRTNNNVWKAL